MRGLLFLVIRYDLDNRLDPLGKNITVNELVEKYLKTREFIVSATNVFVEKGYKNVPLKS